MGKPRQIPHHTLNGSPTPGLFVKRIGESGHVSMKNYPHRDDYYIIAVITEGKSVVSIDFKEITVAAGDAIIISPDQVHSPATEVSAVKGWLVAIASEYFTEQDVELTSAYTIKAQPIHLVGCIEDLDRLFDMLLRHSVHYPLALQLALSIKSLVLFYAGTETPNVNDRYMHISLQLKKLLSIMLKKEKSPSYYAGLLSISEVYLNEAIKAVTGKSVSGFIRSQVILDAKRKLLYTSLSAQEIATELGYGDYAYFSKLFKKETGQSPAQYRKNLK